MEQMLQEVLRLVEAVIKPVVEHVPVQNAKGHLQMIGTK